MPLWFIVLLRAVVLATAIASAIIAYLVVSLTKAAPLLHSRIGRQPLTASVVGPRRMRLKFASSSRSRRRPARNAAMAHSLG